MEREGSFESSIMVKEELNIFSRVIGQDAIKLLFDSALDKDRLAHAYLFHGPDGVGKNCMAMALAMTLQCEQTVTGGCGTCAPCQRSMQFENPGILWVFPAPTHPKSMSLEKYQTILREKKIAYLQNPYLPLDYTPELTSLPLISIDQIRQLKKETHLKIKHGEKRMAIRCRGLYFVLVP